MLKAGIKQCYWIVFLNACGIRALGGVPAILSGITDVLLRRGNGIRKYPLLTIASQDTCRAYSNTPTWIRNSAVITYLGWSYLRLII